MPKVWSVRWLDDDDEFISIGLKEDFAPTYLVREGKPLMPFEAMPFPAAFSIGIQDMLTPLEHLDLDDLIDEFGDIPPMNPKGVPRELLESSANAEDQAVAKWRKDNPQPEDEMIKAEDHPELTF